MVWIFAGVMVVEGTIGEIRDPVHGYIKLDPLARALVETPQLQRLRWIRQLGLASLVYPGASHTRFEHSLGTYYLARVLAGQLELGEDETTRIGAAALLHDIGHGPLSHASESMLSFYLRHEHERVSDILREPEIGSILEQSGVRPAEIQQLINGSTMLGQIISGEIDADRMDYLIRDAHYTGVAYGVFDHLRLMSRMSIHNEELVIDAGGVHAAESLLVSRLLMHPTVYFHHVCRISECMLASAIGCLIDDGHLDPQQIKRMDDMQLFSSMAAAGGYVAEIGERIKRRRLFKRAVYVGADSIDQSVRTARPQLIASEIAESAGVDRKYVLVDSPSFPEVSEGRFPVLIDGITSPLIEVSPLAGILERAHSASWRFGVYTLPELRDRVRQSAERCLSIKKNSVQHTLSGL